jgi:hypothetical protein
MSPLLDPLELYGTLTAEDQRLALRLMRLSQADRQELLTSARSCRDMKAYRALLESRLAELAGGRLQ